MMKLAVEPIPSSYKGFEHIAKLAHDSRDWFGNDVVLDFSRCPFFEANMAAVLFAVLARLRARSNNVKLCKLQSKVTKILRRNHFLSHFDIDTLPDTHRTTLPFAVFDVPVKRGKFHAYLADHMQGKDLPQMSDGAMQQFYRSLFEIFANAGEHSKSNLGIFVCGQFFPKKKRIDFTIVDAGVGIVENVRQYTQITDMTPNDAIEWALRSGNSTRTKSHPGGLGFDFIKEFIHKNQGKLQIISEMGYYEFSQGHDKFQILAHEFPGTCVNIEVNTQDSKAYCLRSELSSADVF